MKINLLSQSIRGHDPNKQEEIAEIGIFYFHANAVIHFGQYGNTIPNNQARKKRPPVMVVTLRIIRDLQSK